MSVLTFPFYVACYNYLSAMWLNILDNLIFFLFSIAATPTTKSPGRSIDFQNTIPANAETNTTLVTNANTQLNSMEDEDPNTEATTVPVNCIRMVYSSVAGSCVEDQEMLCLEDGEGKRLTPPSSEPNMPLTSPEEDGSIAGSPPPE